MFDSFEKCLNYTNSRSASSWQLFRKFAFVCMARVICRNLNDLTHTVTCPYKPCSVVLHECQCKIIEKQVMGESFLCLARLDPWLDSRQLVLDSWFTQESRIKSRIETCIGLSTYFGMVLYFTVLDNKINKLMLKTVHYLGFKLDRKGMLSCSDVAAAGLLVSSLVSVSWFSCKYIKR